MQYNRMGKWGVKLSRVGLGSYLTIGMTLDEKASRATVKAAYDAGVNFFDTANAYNTGEGEKMLGKCLADYDRSSLFVITKVFATMGPGPNDAGLSAKHIKEQCTASLKRLGMDYVDLYMCHRPDPNTPVEETVRAMEDLARQGKIIYWGVSEWSAKQIVEGNAVARQLGARPMGVNQPRYSMLYRFPEAEVFPACLEQGVGNVVFSPLAHGMLTGKYKPGQPLPKGSRAADDRQNAVLKALYLTEENKKKSQKLVSIAKQMGVKAAQLSLAWCLQHPAVTSTIIGASRVEQVEENVKAAEIDVPAEVMAKLDKLFPQPGDRPTV